MYGEIVLRDDFSGEWWHFVDPVEVIEVVDRADLMAQLRYIEQAVETRGVYAAGLLTYEASGAFDEAMVTHEAERPLAWFGLYEKPRPFDLTRFRDEEKCHTIGAWRPTITEAQFAAAIGTIKEAIARGETYQVNYTFRLRADFSGCVRTFFADLQRAQMGAYGAFVDLGDSVICSASPELFFTLDGDVVEGRPMKGTAPRGLTLLDDEARMRWLAQSVKNRAENVMIVDMIRNDLGRIAETGTVRVPGLFEVARYPTVLQMTSTVQARTVRPWAEIVAALFPCASITGAPKVSTMRLIRELEGGPRGIYTGSIGYLAPGRRSQFNVAIRTVAIDRVHGVAEYGTGGGITWDSEAADEYAEAVVKTRVLEARPDFHLLEAILWRPGDGFWLLDEHLDRLAASARYFGFRFDRGGLEKAVAAEARRGAEKKEGDSDKKVRVRLFSDGGVRVEVESFVVGGELTAEARRGAEEEGDKKVVGTLGFAGAGVDSADPFLYHKTSRREVYTAARASRPNCDHVLLWNERGEVTEAAYANVIFELDGRLVTPTLSCGLLPGVLRGHLLADGAINEQVITKEMARQATRIWLINSVRGRWEVRLV